MYNPEIFNVFRLFSGITETMSKIKGFPVSSRAKRADAIITEKIRAAC